MKRVFCLLLLCLLPFILLAHENNGAMNIEKTKEIIYSYEKFKRLKNDSFELIL